MKRLIALLSGIALQLSPAMAHVGGPWSGNTYDNHTDGIFGGMITMRNGSGIFRFSATDTAQLGAFSSSMIYYQGITFFGSCSATIDWESKKISGVTNGSAFNRSPRPAQQQTAPINDNNPNWEPQRPGLAALTLNVPLSPIIVGDQITARTQPLAGLGATGPVGIANSHWSGKITKSKPTPKFEAKGQAAFVGARPLTLRFTIQEGPRPFRQTRARRPSSSRDHSKRFRWTLAGTTRSPNLAILKKSGSLVHGFPITSTPPSAD